MLLSSLTWELSSFFAMLYKVILGWCTVYKNRYQVGDRGIWTDSNPDLVLWSRWYWSHMFVLNLPLQVGVKPCIPNTVCSRVARHALCEFIHTSCFLLVSSSWKTCFCPKRTTKLFAEESEILKLRFGVWCLCRMCAGWLRDWGHSGKPAVTECLNFFWSRCI